MPTLDVIVPTYNRGDLLREALLSLLRATVPPGLDIAITVVDNNSRDHTRAVVEDLIAQTAPTGKPPIRYLLETRQSSSFARNAGIESSHADLIGFIDDDEQVDPRWFEVIAREFADPTTDFIGGPYFAGDDLPLPAWLPPDYPAVIGIMKPRPRGIFGSTFTGNLNGGNSVFRRAVFSRVGLYSPHLGRSGKGLLSEEDAELYSRIRAAGLHGVFVPELVIFHHIPADRLTHHYHRRWCFWRGVSQGLLSRSSSGSDRPREPVPHLLGIPRYRLGRAAHTAVGLLTRRWRTDACRRFNAELSLWDLAGFLYGRFFVRINRFYQPLSPPKSTTP